MHDNPYLLMGMLGDLGGSESNTKECQRRYDVSVVFTFIVGALCDQHVDVHVHILAPLCFQTPKSPIK